MTMTPLTTFEKQLRTLEELKLNKKEESGGSDLVGAKEKRCLV